MSPVKRVRFVTGRISYIVLRSRWCDTIFLYEHAPTEENGDNSRTDSMKNYNKCTIFSMYHLKILLEHFNTNGGNRIFFQPRAGNESLPDDSKDNGVRVVNFATSKNLGVTSTNFSCCTIHKFTWNSRCGKKSIRLIM